MSQPASNLEGKAQGARTGSLPELVPLRLEDQAAVQVAALLWMEVWPYMTRSTALQHTDPVASLTAQDSLWWLYGWPGGGADRVVGLAGLERINLIDKMAQPYLVIAPAHRGKGLGTRMANAMLNKAVRELGLQRIESTVVADSPGRKLLAKLGAKLEGKHKKIRYRNGEWIDGETWALVRG